MRSGSVHAPAVAQSQPLVGKVRNSIALSSESRRGGAITYRKILLTLILFSLGSLVQVASARPPDSLIACQQAPEPQAATPPSVLQIHNDRLSMRARNVPWEVVLRELEHYAGVRIRVEGQIPGTLTQEFEALPLEQGLRRLFRGANLVFLYDKDGPEGAPIGKLTEIWMLPKEGNVAEGKQSPSSSPQAIATGWQQQAEPKGKTAEAIPSDQEIQPESQAADEEQPFADGLETLEAAAKKGNAEALQAALLDPDQSTQVRAFELLAERDGPGALAAVLSMTKSEEPSMRLQALSLLNEAGQADAGTVLSALGAALSDGDADVKSYAIANLVSSGQPDAMEYLRQALRDPDPFTRTMVLEGMAAQGQGLPMLQEALSDEDATVRSTAAFWLQQGTPK